MSNRFSDALKGCSPAGFAGVASGCLTDHELLPSQLNDANGASVVVGKQARSDAVDCSDYISDDGFDLMRLVVVGGE